MKNNSRLSGPDIVRSAAISLVLLTHAFAYSDVLNCAVGSAGWHIFNIIHYLSRICVPLFLLLTGFLQNRREIGPKHYSSVVSVVVPYIFVCVFYILANGVLNGFSASGIFADIVKSLNFGIGYSWYVEMYLCLFLLIPFLNILFDSLDKQKQNVLIISLASITFLPSLVGSFIIRDTKLDILPDFFENMYTVAYYFLGAYIAKYRPAPKKVYCVLSAAAVLLAEDLICAASSAGGYAWWLFNAHSSLSHAVVACCVFLLFYDLDIKNRFVRAVFRTVSVCSFEMYLISFFTDSLFYSYLSVRPLKAYVLNFASAYAAARILRLVTVPLSGFVSGKIARCVRSTALDREKEAEKIC